MRTALTVESVLPVRIHETIHVENHDARIPTPSTSVGTTAPGITEPIEYWDPSPALSGMTFYAGDAFSGWENDLFMGPLSQQMILRIELSEENEVVHQEELLRTRIGRIRDVAVGPDGHIYFLTDDSEGGLYRLEPLQVSRLRPKGERPGQQVQSRSRRSVDDTDGTDSSDRLVLGPLQWSRE